MICFLNILSVSYVMKALSILNALNTLIILKELNIKQTRHTVHIVISPFC